MNDAPFTVLLGVAQDAGHPQVGCYKPCCKPAWEDPTLGHLACSLAIVDPVSSERWIIDVSPDFPEQLHMLDTLQPPRGTAPDLAGVVLTHAHIGHFAGLMYLGREVMGADHVPTHTMPRMAQFLESSGPWDLLCKLGNIDIQPLEEGRSVALNARISIEPFLVPHRAEYTETIGVVVSGPSNSVLYLPDIDRWPTVGTRIEARIAEVDRAYLDGTFFAASELPDRPLSEIPHPLVTHSIERFGALPPNERDKIRFFHLNHSNPLLQPEAPERARVEAAGLHVAQRGERFTL